MPLFKIHRLRDALLQQFRWAPHTAGASQVKPKDYHEEGQIEAPGAYAAWSALRDSEQALRVGDILEDENGVLRIYKYVGLEEAQWIVPEAAPDTSGPLVPDGEPSKVMEP
jgi:hypothetical protein